MIRQVAVFTVEVYLDPIPGWGDNPDDFQRHIQSVLDDTCGSYDPLVRPFKSKAAMPTRWIRGRWNSACCRVCGSKWPGPQAARECEKGAHAQS